MCGYLLLSSDQYNNKRPSGRLFLASRMHLSSLLLDLTLRENWKETGDAHLLIRNKHKCCSVRSCWECMVDDSFESYGWMFLRLFRVRSSPLILYPCTSLTQPTSWTPLLQFSPECHASCWAKFRIPRIAQEFTLSLHLSSPSRL